ncbi:two-component system sensory kinase [Fragilariopsis cylindrus CCMP1102]|uniref:histidine kinase n=1 Tax=Fragilariopsis cylindrus CCMP1102 TaxID=635003 RepID=A0A1E7EU01_9STRA|nr:two-component system sensory kinase [Fragilariopsis cylindrus CCMP1102]|eukprot:OEU09274.1 two-component system sensory kinase [Fragilariopsis cylindrus CCMP1102]
MVMADSSICKEEKNFESTDDDDDDDDDDKMKNTKKNMHVSTSTTSTPTPSTTSTKGRTSDKPFYGDLVCAVAFTVVTPIDGWKAAMTCQQEHYDTDTTTSDDVCTERIFGLCQTALLSVTFCALYGGLNWISYLHHSKKYSFFAFLSGLWLCAFNNLQQWPYAGECVITYQFHGVLVGCLSNGKLSFKDQMIRMVLMFGVASYVSIRSPFSVYCEDVLPLLGGPVLLSIAALAATRSNVYWNLLKTTNWNLLTVQGARWVLAGIYMYHTATDLLSIHNNSNNNNNANVNDNNIRAAQEKLIAITKAAFIACVGVGATGAFQNEIDLNERLEVLVQNRTKEIQEKNDKLHMVELALRASETAIAITDSNLRFIWLNAACEEISTNNIDAAATAASKIAPTKGGAISTGKKIQGQHQVSSQSFLGRTIVEVLALETILDEKKLTRAFASHRREDENNNDDNGSNRYLVVFKNITAERAREEAERTAQEEAMLAKAMEDSMVTLTHELRTPMQGIMGVTSMLLQENKKKDEKQTDTILAESLKLIMASSGLLLNLINNLLDVKKVNSEMMDSFPMSSVIARSAIKDTIDFCQPLASISGVSVVTDYGNGRKNDFMVVSNALRLQQVLINLVSNAIKYTEEESQICIRIRPTIMTDVEYMIDHALASSRDDNSNDGVSKKDLSLSNHSVLCFSISDCGPGIAPHQADRLFRRFARLDNKPTRALGGGNKIGQPSGTGLGLNLCQLFLHRMNGEIWATNNSNGRGSTFSFFLPLAIDNNPNIDSRITAPVEMSNNRCRSFEDLSLTTSQLRILLVDDVLINRKVIGRMVKLIGIVDIVTVDSGENALIELFKNGPYDLVISDLQMPGMSGTELCEAIMADTNGCLSRKPVVVGLTADTSVKVAENCSVAGMSAVMYKPISVIEMRDFFGKTVGRLKPGVWYTSNTEVLAAQ